MSIVSVAGGAGASDPSIDTADPAPAAAPEGAIVRGAPPARAAAIGAAATSRAAVDPLLMPQEIVDFEKSHMWGMHHLEWHMERRWASFTADPQNAAYAKKMGWKPAPRQEGDPGNGMDFLAMHRAMIQTLEKKFPQDASLFAGWTSPPTDPKDPQNPVPSGLPMDPKALQAIDTLTHLKDHLAAFPNDDALGRFIETSFGAAFDPSLGMQGIHNYLHNRFDDPKSPIDMGDPTVNIENKMFWRLHGWIDGIWTQYRALEGETASDPAYKKAIADAAKMMNMPMHMGSDKAAGALGTEPPAPPESVRKFLERNP
jgi:hypothetical protein